MGLKDKKLSEQLQLDSKLTLEKAITKSRQSETVKKQQSFLKGNTLELQPASVDRLSQGKGKEEHAKGKDHETSPKPKNKAQKSAEARCCGPSHAKRLCPARESKCMKCSKVGHWAKACSSH